MLTAGIMISGIFKEYKTKKKLPKKLCKGKYIKLNAIAHDQNNIKEGLYVFVFHSVHETCLCSLVTYHSWEEEAYNEHS